MQISEEAIDHLIETMDTSPDGVNRFWSHSQSQFPELSHYILNVDQDILTEDEYGQMLFIAMVILSAYKSVGSKSQLPDVPEKISKIEDQNWELLDNQRGDFRTKLNVFFDQYPEEDLLAFVEDLLVDDEVSEISQVGREVIFVKLKTVIDFLLALNLFEKEH